jgi:hypothetical protein
LADTDCGGSFKDRARVFAKELYDAKLLSEEGWKRVERGK